MWCLNALRVTDGSRVDDSVKKRNRSMNADDDDDEEHVKQSTMKTEAVKAEAVAAGHDSESTKKRGRTEAE
jgi:hypothetical protein